MKTPDNPLQMLAIKVQQMPDDIFFNFAGGSPLPILGFSDALAYLALIIMCNIMKCEILCKVKNYAMCKSMRCANHAMCHAMFKIMQCAELCKSKSFALSIGVSFV